MHRPLQEKEVIKRRNYVFSCSPILKKIIALARRRRSDQNEDTQKLPMNLWKIKLLKSNQR
ncbi:hypothetical protein Avbf_02986 [Armadillidium vulgare]|nr:hypothetical protein Avbf_02986 [Armadillidium vulgare]